MILILWKEKKSLDAEATAFDPIKAHNLEYSDYTHFYSRNYSKFTPSFYLEQNLTDSNGIDFHDKMV